MKRRVLTGAVCFLLICIGAGSCDFLMGPDKPAGNGNLVINLGGGAGRAITSGAESDTPGKAGGLFCEPLKAVCFGTA
jgi:hypothetical protein